VETPLLNENLIVKKKMILEKKKKTLSHFFKKEKKKCTEKKTRFLLFLFFSFGKILVPNQKIIWENGTSTYTTIPINQKDF